VDQIYDRGRCVDSGKNHLFFSERPDELAAAQALCMECEVRLACLELALDEGQEWGVWGGVIFIDGRSFYRKRARGRPRRNDQNLPLEASLDDLRELVKSA
jgi:WhiB family transcriptional regulator, redox-sensing transcriptional regulator